jgi:hypothetical protein
LFCFLFFLFLISVLVFEKSYTSLHWIISKLTTFAL